MRPILEYGNCIWCPLFKRQSILIEQVQRRATKLLSKIDHLSYLERLKILKIPSLKYRRLRGDLIHLFKFVHNIDNMDCNYFFRFSHVTNTRGDKYKIYIERCNTAIRGNSFVFRMVNVWNGLSFKTKDSDSIDIFKNSIDKELNHLMYDYDE